MPYFSTKKNQLIKHLKNKIDSAGFLKKKIGSKSTQAGCDLNQLHKKHTDLEKHTFLLICKIFFQVYS